MKATYIDHMGSDLTVVNAARVSFAKIGKWETDEIGTFLSKKDTKLLRYLATHKHWTPFAHPQITLHMKAPIFVRTQCFKHVVGFVANEISRRYVDDAPEFYIPNAWRGRAENKKQGSSDEMIPGIGTDYEFAMAEIAGFYEYLLGKGVAPEQARMVLPQSMLTEWYWTGSLSAWARFYYQRTHDGAQLETKLLAKQCGEIIAPLFPVSWATLTAEPVTE